MRHTLDRLAGAAARRLVAWTSIRIDPAQRAWLEAMTAELDAIEGGSRQLRWAAGAVRLIRLRRGRSDAARAYPRWPIPLVLLDGAILLWFGLRLAERYPLIGGVLLVLTALGVGVAVPVLTLAAAAFRRRVAALPGGGRSRPATVAAAVAAVAVMIGVVLTAALPMLQVLASGPDNTGLVVGAGDRVAVQSLLDRTPAVTRGDTFLTTQVRPLMVNGVPLDRLSGRYGQPAGSLGPDPGPIQPQQAAWLVHQFSGIQGFDLAHGQVPEAIGFGSDLGSTGPGPDEIDGPPGRMIGPADASSLNVMIPLTETPDVQGRTCMPGPHGRGPCTEFRAYNGDTIGVQSLVTGQVLNLHVVGQYTPEDGTVTQLYGRVLADDSVVRTLSGGRPSTAFGLRMDTGQRSALTARVHAIAPSARVYDFSDGPSSSWFTDLNTEEAMWMLDHLALVGQAAAASALLAALIIVACREPDPVGPLD